MNIDQAREYKQKVEQEILEIIRKFEDDTRCTVTYIAVEQYRDTTSTKTYQIKLEVEL